MKINIMVTLIFLFVLCTSCAKINTHDRMNSYLWMSKSYEYEGLAKAIYENAIDKVESLETEPSIGDWGVIMDIDETILNNSIFQHSLIIDGTSFSPEHWDTWVKSETASAVPGSKKFIDRVRSLGGLVVLVSNRNVKNLPHTKRNLMTLGIEYDGIYLKDKVSKKEERWNKSVSDLSYIPVMWVGDQLSDFPLFEASKGDDIVCPPYNKSMDYNDSKNIIKSILNIESGKCLVILPNPAYGKWEE